MRAYFLAVGLALLAPGANAGGLGGAVVRAISPCWDAGSASVETLSSTVTVFASVRPDGSVETVKQVSASGPSVEATTVAFDLARRAILRCARSTLIPGLSDLDLTFDYVTMTITATARRGDGGPVKT